MLTIIIEPVLNPLWVWLLLGETPGAWSILGGGIIISTIIVRALAPITGQGAKQVGVGATNC